MLGQPALVPRHHRGDPQRVALLAQQRVPAVPRPVTTRSPGSRGNARCTWSHGTATAHPPAPAPAARPPSARTARTTRTTRSRPAPPPPIRVMIRIETATYAESVISTPSWEISPPSGPMQNGTTYITRPRMHPSKISGERLAHLVGRDPVVRRPRVLLPFGADERAVLHPGHVRGIRPAPEAVRPQLRIQPGERPVLHQQAGQPVPLIIRAITPHDRVRLGQLRDLARPTWPARAASSLRVSRSGLRWPCLSLPERTNVRRHAQLCACELPRIPG